MQQQAENPSFRLLSREEFSELSISAKCDYLASMAEAPESSLHLFTAPRPAIRPTEGEPASGMHDFSVLRSPPVVKILRVDEAAKR